MGKTANKLVESMGLRVTMDDGAINDYQSTPVDVWRVEKITGKAIHEALLTFTGIAALAFSCAVRADHVYRQRGGKSDDVSLYEEWLEHVTDVAVLSDDEETDRPLEGSSGSS